MRVSLLAGDDEARFTLELINNGPYMIYEVIFPWVGGWHGYSGEWGVIQCGTNPPLNPFTDLRRNDGCNLLNSTRKRNIGFPHVNVPMCDIHNEKVGLSYNFYPEACDLNYDLFIMDLNEHIGDAHPSFGWVHRPFLQTGGHWKSGVVGIAPHQGDWHVAADKMRNWLATWWKAPALPASLRGAIGFHNACFRDFQGLELRPLSSLPGLARYGLEHGVQHIIVWDMPLLGMYVRAGSGGLFEDRPERITELKEALRGVRRMGVWGSPLINMRLTTQATPMIGLRNPTCLPASEAYRLRSSIIAVINRARCTMRKGSVREAARRLISTASSVVNVRSFTGFRISSS